MNRTPRLVEASNRAALRGGPVLVVRYTVCFPIVLRIREDTGGVASSSGGSLGSYAMPSSTTFREDVCTGAGDAGSGTGFSALEAMVERIITREPLWLGVPASARAGATGGGVEEEALSFGAGGGTVSAAGSDTAGAA